MAGKKKIERALPAIKAFFSERSGIPFSLKDISQAYHDWDLPQSMTIRRFIAYLLAETPLTKTTMEFPHRKETRYTWGEVDVFQLARSIRPRGYFSHYTAMSLHDLTDQIPSTLYLNTEQSPKPPSQTPLAQGRIDAAFQRKPRLTSNKATCGGRTICLLNGKCTNQQGVTTLQDAKGNSLPVTGLERTLIDIAVRPFNAGGVFEVLRAYKAAKGLVDVQAMETLLRKLDYVYPYHQVIGFYLDRAGVYTQADLDVFRGLPREFDFYLTYGIKNPSYSDSWRLFFPEGL